MTSDSILANNRRFMLLPPKVSLCFARLRGLGLLGFALGSSGADGAACALAAGVNHGLPRVAVRTCPPDSFVAAKGHIVRRQGCVLFAVPLCEQLRFSLFGAKRSKCSSDRQPPPHEKSSVPAKPDGAVTNEYISKGATGCHSVFSIRRGVRPIWLCVAAFRRFCQNMRF